MLHEAVQTVASEAYASNEWQSDKDISSFITIASKSGKKVTNFEDNGTYDIFKNRYSEVVKLAEVPSLTNGDGDFVAMLDQKVLYSACFIILDVDCSARIIKIPVNTRYMTPQKIYRTIKLTMETITMLSYVLI